MKVLHNTYDGKIYFNEKAYTDRVDVTLDISLYEYGIIRNPKNGKTIIRVGLDNTDCFYNLFMWTYISLEDVKEALEDMEDGYFSYADIENKEEYIKNLDNENLAHEIHSINSYDGHFRGCY